MATHSAAFEALEGRRLLSAVVTDGRLYVTGTSAADRISVYEDTDNLGNTTDYRLLVDPLPPGGPMETYEIPAEGVRGILVRAGGGDDRVDLWSAPLRPNTSPVRIPSVVDAGVGNDTVWGGRSRDRVYGGFGDDDLRGLDGDDWINGGWGRDQVDGGTGNDSLYGFVGNDSIAGGFGNDRISGGPGDDSLAGEEGNDRLYGGPGNDHLGSLPIGPRAGEPGNDFLDGGDGIDRLYGGAGTDRVFGGPGRDVWLEGWTPADKDADAERVDRTPDEPIEMIPATR